MSLAMKLRVTLVATLVLVAPVICGTSMAQAANPAETFVSDTIQTGYAILNDTKVLPAQKRIQFQAFLLKITDMKRTADFTLGQYGPTASQPDRAAFEAAFQDYAIAVYQSYFDKYAGQTLKITGSTDHAADDFVVATNLVNAKDDSGQEPLAIDFRVRTDSGTPVIVDFSVAGIWLALEERDQFSAFLGRNSGNIPALSSHLIELREKYSASN